MSLSDVIPFDAPTDESSGHRMPGQRRFSPIKPIDSGAIALYPKQAAPEGAPRSLSDIPERFRHPAKPPVRR